MNKFSITICFCLSFVLFMACERPDLSDEIRSAYRESGTADTAGDTGDSGLAWSAKASSSMAWDDAVSYCENLVEGGYSDWHLPTISELRTLIQNCSGTVTGGSCGVTDSCLTDSCWSDVCYCSSDSSGKYSKLGDTGYFCSSSTVSDDTSYAWSVGFDLGEVDVYNKYHYSYVRCVR